MQKRLEEITEEVQGHEGIHENYITAGQEVKEVCDDLLVLETEEKDVERRWLSLKEGLERKKQETERAKALLDEHHKSLDQVKDVNEKMKEILDSDDLYQLDSDKMSENLYKAKVSKTNK